MTQDEFVRRLHAQAVSARRANDREALERILDNIGRAEMDLTVEQRASIWLDVGRGIAPMGFETTRDYRKRTKEANE